MNEARKVTTRTTEVGTFRKKFGQSQLPTVTRSQVVRRSRTSCQAERTVESHGVTRHHGGLLNRYPTIMGLMTIETKLRHCLKLAYSETLYLISGRREMQIPESNRREDGALFQSGCAGNPHVFHLI
jgi:hypothetical protein